MEALDKFKNNIAKGIFGMSVVEAREKGVCLECNQPALPNCYSETGIREYKISGLCEKCFDKITGGDEDEA